NASMALRDWARLGITRVTGKPLPQTSETARFYQPAGGNGPVFLVLKNFEVIKRYNNADKYAFAVGLLADQIAGYGNLVQDWNRPFTKLSFEERQELQKRLSDYGYYSGKFDGKIGEGSKAAIMAFQAQAGLTQDGHPSMEVLKSLRQR
ncbi:MAG: peptidoglycan-binding protein, partial [Mesorhizobium sp.]|nr:peptidoglycan-binding protein [Mesorhizobium sp.]